jgi:hypothetical protein
MPTEVTQGTQTAVIGTEHTLGGEQTANRRFEAYIDLTNMVAGDTVEIRAYVKVISAAGTFRCIGPDTFTGDQGENELVYVLSVPSKYGWKLTLKQTVGTARTFDWIIYEVNA